MGELLKEMGQRMLDRRKQLRLTQETLAKMAHVTRKLSQLLNWEQKPCGLKLY